MSAGAGGARSASLLQLLAQAQRAAAELVAVRGEEDGARAAAEAALDAAREELAQARGALAAAEQRAADASTQGGRAAARVQALGAEALAQAESLNQYMAQVEALRGRMVAEQRRADAAQRRVAELGRAGGGGAGAGGMGAPLAGSEQRARGLLRSSMAPNIHRSGGRPHPRASVAY
eukprot:g4437.t1